jgi:hypothetical protein
MFIYNNIVGDEVNYLLIQMIQIYSDLEVDSLSMTESSIDVHRPLFSPTLMQHGVVVVDLLVTVADPNPPSTFADACFNALKGKNEKKRIFTIRKM